MMLQLMAKQLGLGGTDSGGSTDMMQWLCF
jgi:hypothetical protein